MTPQTKTLTLEEVRNAHYERVLVQNHGNRSVTARILGVSRKSVQRWIRDHSDRVPAAR